MPTGHSLVWKLTIRVDVEQELSHVSFARNEACEIRGTLLEVSNDGAYL